MKTYKAEAKQRKGGMDIKKILPLTLLGVGIYLLFTRKAQAEEITEEFIPAEKPQDQLTQQLYQQLSPSTIIERVTEETNIFIKKVTEEANIKIQQIKEGIDVNISEITKKANEELEALKAKMETAYQLSQWDLIQDYRARDEIIRAETGLKIELARIEAEQKAQAVRVEAAKAVEAARLEAAQKVEAARLEAEQKIEAARAAEAQKPILWDGSGRRVDSGSWARNRAPWSEDQWRTAWTIPFAKEKHRVVRLTITLTENADGGNKCTAARLKVNGRNSPPITFEVHGEGYWERVMETEVNISDLPDGSYTVQIQWIAYAPGDKTGGHTVFNPKVNILAG